MMISKSMYSEMDLVSFRLEAKIASLQKDSPNGFTLQSLSPKCSLSLAKDLINIKCIFFRIFVTKLEVLCN